MKANEKPALACMTCAKAKSRCIPGPAGSEKCERCHRLKKTCLEREPAPPRARKPVKRSRVAQLEKRLRELEEGGGTNRLSPATEHTESTTRSPFQDEGNSPAAESKTPPVDKARITVHAARPFFTHLFLQDRDISGWPEKQSVVDPLSSRPSWESLWPLPDEAEMLLGEYRTRTAHLYPFILVPDMKASLIKESRPFLWKALMMVTCFLDGARHDRLAEELLAEIVKVSMVDGERSLDLLQSIQLLVAWFHMKSSRMMNLLFLARSMCLGLGMGGHGSINFTVGDGRAQNLDALRAYAGTYYVNTLVFTTNKSTEVLMNTSYLDQCCDVLETANQYESDELLVKLVRVQQISQSISKTLSVKPGEQPMHLPMHIVVHSFQDQINTLRQSLSPELASNAMLQSHLAIAEVLLTEWAIGDNHGTANMALTDRLRLLWSCVRALKSVFSTRMGFWSAIGNPRFLCMHSSDLSCALLTGIRLVTLRLPGWNLEHIERELAFSDVMDGVVGHLAELVKMRWNGKYSVALYGVSDGVPPPNVEDPIEGLMKLCSGLRGRIRAEMARAIADSQAGVAGEEATGIQTPPMSTDTVAEFDDLGDFLWKDFVIDAAWSGGGQLDDFMVQ